MKKLNFNRILSVMVVFIALIVGAPFALAQSTDYTVTSSDGVVIAVQEAGNPNGIPVVFIHGLLGSRLDWAGQVGSAQLARYRLITYDLRGHGLSGKPTQAIAYTDGYRWADDLAAVINGSHAHKPILVGWSLGGITISNYLAKYGDSNISSAMYVDGVIELTADLLVPHPDVYANLVSPDLLTHLNAIRDFLTLCFYTQPPQSTFQLLYASAAMASWDMQQYIFSVSVYAVQGLGHAHVPVLLLFGAKDALVQPNPTIARAKAINPAVKSKIYANSGHAPFIEETARFNGDLAAFINATAAH
ncbi:alpha/beta hydrolase [Acerihabitans sp. KWT182]|uniref:Alpha/beta hydrolase n=1 Tax=Acerihabitans sp. KWT182 TaxID=3157919 RepID=A0AAU7Q9M3_9GAMM